MFSKMMTQIGFMLCLSIATLNCLASDEKHESEMANDIQKTLMVGHPIWLKAGGKEFLSLLTETTKNPRVGMIILLHDIGENPNQQGVIKNLRLFFPEHHWSTLSIQMPVREATAPLQDYYALFSEAKERLKTALDFAKKEKIEKIAVIGYGLGGLMAIYTLTEIQTDEVNALITISLPVPETTEIVAKTLVMIPKLNLPMLDIYGTLDVANVVQSARERQVASKTNPHYRQIKIDHEGHSYLHDDGLLVKRVYSWLNSNEVRKGIQTKIK